MNGQSFGRHPVNASVRRTEAHVRMATRLLDLHCDETRIDAGPAFYIGMLRCSPARSRRLQAAIDRVRQQHGLQREMKWTKVSRAMLVQYEAFANVLLECNYSRFILFRITRNSDWQRFAKTEDERFFKTYYVVLRLSMRLDNQYNIFVDDKPCKRYRWSSVEYAIRGAGLRDHGIKKQIKAR